MSQQDRRMRGIIPTALADAFLDRLVDGVMLGELADRPIASGGPFLVIEESATLDPTQRPSLPPWDQLNGDQTGGLQGGSACLFFSYQRRSLRNNACSQASLQSY